MRVRFQKTSRGEVAILPRREYELLAAKASEAEEDAGTARIVADARKEIAGGGPLLPKAVVDRLANGQNPVRILREWRDITQMHLSFKTNLSQGYISDIENGRRVGTVAALRLIANVLDVPLDLLVYEAGKLRTDRIVCIDDQNPYFQMIRGNWGKSFRAPNAVDAAASTVQSIQTITPATTGNPTKDSGWV